MEDAPSITFLIIRRTPSKSQLVGFHLSLPMVYVDSAPYFCMANKTVSDLANVTLDQNN